MVIELMGHHAGWITLYAGMAGGADIILLPELGYDMKVIIDKIKNGWRWERHTPLWR
jgi:6-phosphofructokinase 1